MAVLIVDDEDQTRAVIRELLTQMGCKAVLEASHGQEALKTVDAEKTRIELVVADWEMPVMDGFTLARELLGVREIDSAPFLLITSDLPRAKLTELNRLYPRIDAYLSKPFRLSALRKSLAEAFAARTRSRSGIFVLGQRVPEGLGIAMEKQKGSSWKLAGAESSVAQMESRLASMPRDVGALLIDPSLWSSSDENARRLSGLIADFKRTPSGASTPVIVLSRSPDAVYPLRTSLQFLVDPDAGPKEWLELLKQAFARSSTRWELELLMQETRSALQDSDSGKAKALVRQMLELNPANPEVKTLEAELADTAGDPARAAKLFVQAMELNPCSPKPYIKLLSAAISLKPGELETIADSGARFCPESPDVLWAVAQALVRLKLGSRAEPVLKKILTLDPAHSGARQLLATLSCNPP